jgi:hypothetical protein
VHVVVDLVLWQERQERLSGCTNVQRLGPADVELHAEFVIGQ